MQHERTADHRRTVCQEAEKKAANKIDGIVALAMASLEAVRGASELPLVLMVV